MKNNINKKAKYLVYDHNYMKILVKIDGYKIIKEINLNRTGYSPYGKAVSWNRKIARVIIGDSVFGVPDLEIRKNANGENIIWNKAKNKIEYGELFCECNEKGTPLGMLEFEDDNVAALYFVASENEWEDEYDD